MQGDGEGPADGGYTAVVPYGPAGSGGSESGAAWLLPGGVGGARGGAGAPAPSGQYFGSLSSFELRARGRVNSEVAATDADLRNSRRPGVSKLQHGSWLQVAWRLVSYRFDTYFQRRAWQTAGLAFIAAALCLAGGYAVSLVRDDEDPGGGDLAEGFWKAWTYMLDPGAQACDTSLLDTPKRIVASLVTLGGVFCFACVLAFFTEAVRDKMELIKLGRSAVVEENHTLVLNWNSNAVPVIREIATAAESEGGTTVVVLAPRSKQDMETEIDSQINKQDLRGTRIVCRTGSPMYANDLNNVSAATARACVVLAPSSDSADTQSSSMADGIVVRVVLALQGLHTPLQGHIVAELCNIDNEPLVQLVGGNNVETVVSRDIVGRLVLATAHQPGLADVYRHVFGFEGNEFYFRHWSELQGVPFGDVQRRLPSAIAVGVRLPHTGAVLLNPHWERPMGAGEELLVIAEDDSSYRVEEPHFIDVDKHEPQTERKPDIKAEKVLILGWRDDLVEMILGLEAMCGPGSEVWLCCETPPHKRELLLDDGTSIETAVENITIRHHCGNTTVRATMEELQLGQMNKVLVVADEALNSNIMHMDSHSIATLLLVRDVQRKILAQQRRESNLKAQAGRPAIEECTVVCEILETRTYRTVSNIPGLLESVDFVQSKETVSQVLAMVSEARGIKGLLNELLNAWGASFEVVPAARYVSAKALNHISFFELSHLCSRAGVLVAGYFPYDAKEFIMNPPAKHLNEDFTGRMLIVITGRSNPDWAGGGVGEDEDEEEEEDDDDDDFIPPLPESSMSTPATGRLRNARPRSSHGDTARNVVKMMGRRQSTAQLPHIRAKKSLTSSSLVAPSPSPLFPLLGAVPQGVRGARSVPDGFGGRGTGVTSEQEQEEDALLREAEDGDASQLPTDPSGLAALVREQLQHMPAADRASFFSQLF